MKQKRLGNGTMQWNFAMNFTTLANSLSLNVLMGAMYPVSMKQNT